MFGTALVPVAKASLAAVGFAINIYLGRALGAGGFGLYSGAIAIVVVFASFIQHVTDAAYLRQLDVIDQEGIPLLGAADLNLRLLGVLLSVLLLALGTGATLLLGVPLPFSQPVLVLIASGVGGTILMSHPQIIHQSRRHFGRYLRVDVALNGLRVAALAGCVLAAALTAERAIAIYTLSTVLAALVVWPRGVSPKHRLSIQVRQHMWDMALSGRWIGVAFICSILTNRLDILMLSAMAGPEATGHYAAAMNLAMLAEFAGSFLLIIFYPRILEWHRDGVLFRILIRYLVIVVPAALITGAISRALAGPVIQLFYGDEFTASAALLTILLPGTLYMMVIQPIAAPFINLHAPRVLFGFEATGLVAVLLAYPLCINLTGATGAAWVALGIRLAIGSAILIWALLHAGRQSTTQEIAP